MRHAYAGATLLALGVAGAPGGASAADIVFAAVDAPSAIAKAHTFVGILERLSDRHTASVAVVGPDALLATMTGGEAHVTFDADPDAADFAAFEESGLLDLGPNQMGGAPERHTMVARDLTDDAPEVVEFLNLYFVSATRLAEMAGLVEDGTVPEAALEGWIADNEPWIRNMLALCPEFRTGACEEGESPRPVQAKDWYGTPAADR